MIRRDGETWIEGLRLGGDFADEADEADEEEEEPEESEEA